MLVLVLIVLSLLILVVYFRSREQLEKQQEQEEGMVGSRFTTPRYLREDARAREDPTMLRRRLSESDNQMYYERMMDGAAKQVRQGGGRRLSCDTQQSLAWGGSPLSQNNLQMGQKRLINAALVGNQEESSRKLTPEMLRLGTIISIAFKLNF